MAIILSYTESKCVSNPQVILNWIKTDRHSVFIELRGNKPKMYRVELTAGLPNLADSGPLWWADGGSLLKRRLLGTGELLPWE